MTLQSIRLRGEKEKRREEEGRKEERERERESASTLLSDDDDAVVWGNLMKRRREGGFFRKGKERRGGEKNLKLFNIHTQEGEKREAPTRSHTVFIYRLHPIFCHSHFPLSSSSLFIRVT